MDRIKIILGITLETSYEVVYKVATQKEEKNVLHLCAPLNLDLSTQYGKRELRRNIRNEKKTEECVNCVIFKKILLSHIMCFFTLNIINSFVEGEALCKREWI